VVEPYPAGMAEPGGSGPVGPYPPEVETDEQRADYDKLRRRVLWKMPTGLYVIGSRGADPAAKNFMTANWLTQLSFDPKWVGVGVEQAALTHDLIAQSGRFSVCFIDREDRAIVRKFTKPVEVDLEAHTMNGFAFIERITGAPILAQSVAYLDCEVRQQVPAGHHTLFLGEIVDCGFLRDEETPILRMEDTRMNYGG
jgi:flavin reductase (DIM6/NTAB) family NADH-FMN oxidoreductase RutF